MVAKIDNSIPSFFGDMDSMVMTRRPKREMSEAEKLAFAESITETPIGAEMVKEVAEFYSAVMYSGANAAIRGLLQALANGELNE